METNNNPIEDNKSPGMGKVDILNDKITKVILHLAIPIFFGMIFQLLHNIVNTIWVSRIDLTDPSYPGAVGLVFPIFFLAIAIANGLITGISSYSARLVGAGKQAQIGSVFSSMGLIVIVLLALFLFFGYKFGENILIFLGAHGNYLTHSLDYFNYILPAMILLLLGSLYVGALQGLGRMKPVMIAMFIGTILNIAIDPLLIFTFKLGIKGAAIGTLIAQSFSMIYILISFHNSPEGRKISFSLFRIDFSALKEILSVGSSQSLNQLLIAISYIVFNYFIIRISENALTAFSIVGRIDQVIMLPIIAISIALITAVGQNYSKGHFERVNQLWKSCNNMAFIPVFILCTIMVVMAPAIFKQFSDINEVVKLSVLQVRTIEYGFLFVVIQVLASSFFQAINRPGPAIILTLLRLLVLPVFAILILLATNNLNIQGIWASILAINLIAAIISWVWVYSTNRELNSRASETMLSPL